MSNTSPSTATATPMSTPAERLAASRERLRLSWREAAAARNDASVRADATSWLSGLKSIPGAGLVVEALQGWWKKHPLHAAGTLVADALAAVVRPTAQRHPFVLVAAALLVGGLLVSSRPWRWILTPTLLAGLLPQLLTKAVALVPAQSWLAVLATLAQGQKDAAPPPRRDAAAPATQPPAH